MLCLDNNEQAIARFEASSWAIKKNGKWEKRPVVTGVMLDEVVISTIAMVEDRRRPG